MNLTAIQVEAIRNGEAVHFTDSQANVDCVILRADLYQRVRSLFEDAPLSGEEKLGLLMESGKRAGWDDPAMDDYDDYDANHK